MIMLEDNISPGGVPSPWLDTAKAAGYLGARPGTLKNWRHLGEGPKYHVINRRLVRYHRNDLDAFARRVQPGRLEPRK